MTKVAIIIPTMNRPDFLLRHFRFYKLTKSPHPIYISDSSSEENSEKIKKYIKDSSDLKIVYQWSQPGADNIYELLPLVEEKYCIQIGDDDLVIPQTISKCANFLEHNPGYATCGGKQVNIRFQKEDYNKPYGIIARQTRPFGRSIEHENMLARLKDFWSDPTFICFTVRRVETEKIIRNLSKNFSLMERMMEFLLWSIFIISGKAKIIEDTGYIMQISGNRGFTAELAVDFLMSPTIKDKWSISQKGLSKIIEEKGFSGEESLKIAKWAFILYLAHHLKEETTWLSVPDLKRHYFAKNNLLKRLNFYISGNRGRMKEVKDFLEQNR